MTPSVVFVAAAALHYKFPISSQFSKNAGSLPKTYTHVLSTSGKVDGRGPREKLWDVAGVRY